ncbi:hypothetical protein [Pontibacter russatus]|uniref:hypothetical protein n=1 Tax=Pontibacter russatus TaxID=2694929 RepID=UPI001379CDB9|nr:hypothetical protein [Pontibacter russatus]
MRNTLYLVGQVAVLAALKIDINDNAAIERSGLQLNNGHQYLRLNITNKGGIVELLDTNTRQIDGESTFNGMTLEEGVNLALEKIRFGYATSATVGGETDPTLVKYSNVYSDVPAVLANADLVITQQGKDILSVPVRNLLVGAESERTAGNVDSYESGVIRVLRSKTPIKISLRFPKGASIGNAANHFIELHLHGAATARKA